MKEEFGVSIVALWHGLSENLKKLPPINQYLRSTYYPIYCSHSESCDWQLWFHQHAERCLLFSYGGCGGNTNNFQSEESCISTCGGPTGALIHAIQLHGRSLTDFWHVKLDIFSYQYCIALQAKTERYVAGGLKPRKAICSLSINRGGCQANHHYPPAHHLHHLHHSSPSLLSGKAPAILFWSPHRVLQTLRLWWLPRWPISNFLRPNNFFT